MDYLTLTSTLMVFTAFLQVLVTSVIASSEEKVQLAKRIDRVSRVAFPGVFACMVVWSLFL